jgi:hypothetical protein
MVTSDNRDSVALSEALGVLIHDLTNLALDAGLTIQEIFQLIRENSAFVALQRLKRNDELQSNSRVAITTGLSRAEVAKFFDPKTNTAKRIPRLPIRKLITTWTSSKMFVSAGSVPKILPIYGRGSSFEGLVRATNKGVPVRAMLDQLIYAKSAKILVGQRVQLVPPLPAYADVALVREFLSMTRSKANLTQSEVTSIKSTRKNLKRKKPKPKR